MRLWIWVVALGCWVSAGAMAAEGEVLKGRIEALLMAVEKSDARFVRNGDEHAGKDAVKHMRRKYDHYKKEIKTPEDFIAKCAAKSEMSGKAYMIKTAEGKLVKAEDWMKAKLAELEKEKEKKAEVKPATQN